METRDIYVYGMYSFFYGIFRSRVRLRITLTVHDEVHISRGRRLHTHTVEQKETNSREDGNSREKPDIISRNTRIKVGGKINLKL